MRNALKREVLAVGAITVLSAVVAIVLYELWIRVDLASRIEQHYAVMPLWLQNQMLVPSPGDPDHHDFSKIQNRVIYRPNARFDLAAEVGGKTVLDFSVQTNNAGLLSERPVNEERPVDSNEYRILVYGDSLTGTVTANYQWVDTVEDLLNSRPALARALGSDRFKVVNLGWVAAGFGQFWIAHERIGRRLDGNLIIVNFTYDDFPRQTEGARYSVPSERAEMIANAANALGNFVDTGISVLVTQMPTHDEIWPEKVDYEMTAEVAERLEGVRFVDMRKRLPIDLGPRFIRDLYNMPYDHHMSDLGGEYYARAMASVIAEHLTGKTVDFSTTKTKFYDPALCHREKLSVVGKAPDRVIELPQTPPQGVELTETPAALGRQWSAYASGTGGKGTGRISRHEDGDEEPYVIFTQATPSQSGSPSLTVTLGGASTLAGSAARLRFRARGEGTTRFQLVVARFLGSDKGTAADKHIDNVPFVVDGDWRDIDIPISLPPLKRSDIGAAGNDHVRLQLIPSSPDATFSLSFTAPRIYRVDRNRDFEKTASECLAKPRVATEVREILDSRENITELRSFVLDKLGRAKTTSFRPYFIDIIFRGLDPLVPPLDKPLIGGFIEVPLSNLPQSNIRLNVFCTSGEVSMHNSACYTNQHFFVD